MAGSGQTVHPSPSAELNQTVLELSKAVGKRSLHAPTPHPTVPRVSLRVTYQLPWISGLREMGGPPSRVSFPDSDQQGAESPPKASCCGSWGKDPGFFQRSVAHWLGSCERRGTWERAASLPSSREALRRLSSSRKRGSAGRRNPLPSFPAAASRATWPPRCLCLCLRLRPRPLPRRPQGF